MGAGDEEGWAQGQNDDVKETEHSSQILFLNTRRGEDSESGGGWVGAAGLRKACRGAGH